MHEKLKQVQGTFMRVMDSALIFIAGSAALYCYYTITFMLCADNACDKLSFTKTWVNSASLYIVFGISLIGVAVFMYTEKELPKIYAYAITLTALLGSVFSIKIVFSILKELNTLT